MVIYYFMEFNTFSKKILSLKEIILLWMLWLQVTEKKHETGFYTEGNTCFMYLKILQLGVASGRDHLAMFPGSQVASAALLCGTSFILTLSTSVVSNSCQQFLGSSPSLFTSYRTRLVICDPEVPTETLVVNCAA